MEAARLAGLLALETVFRRDEPIGHKDWTRSKRRGERDRWPRAVAASETSLDGRASAIHVMDREADSYVLLAALCEADRSFVIRAFQDRVLCGEDEARLRDAARAAKATLHREVPLSSRPQAPGPKGKRHPARRFRLAKLNLAATAVELPRTSDSPLCQRE